MSGHIDVKSIIEDISNRYNENNVDNELNNIRMVNHKLYYSIDVDFLYNVDIKYKNIASEIINRYNFLNPKNILIEDKHTSENTSKLLIEIDKDIKDLKEKIKKDLNTVIDYVDRLASKIDISNVTRETPLGILILNKYDSFIVYSADLDISDLNNAMRRQSKRLIYIKELDYLIRNYNNFNCKYNVDNTKNFINNLYDLIGKYLYLLTNSEFEYTKEAIKKILAYKFNFIDKYLPTYKIILMKIWNSKLTNDYYFICDVDLDKDNIYLMSDRNVDLYKNCGYICDVPKNFISYFNMDDMDIIEYPLPCNLNDKYEVKTNNFDRSKANLKAMYTIKDSIDFKSILPIIYLNKNKNA